MSLSPRRLAWFLTAVWFVWIAALQAFFISSPAFDWPVPDVVTIMLATLAVVYTRRGLLPLAIIAALARKSFSIDPPVAILCGSLAVVAAAYVLRAVIELRSPLWRNALAALCAVLFPLWLALVRDARNIAELEFGWGALTSTLFGGVLVAFLCGGLFVHLPGIRPLMHERW